jgi:hypothetical protein
MAFTNDYLLTKPDGTEFASTIDDIIKELKAAIDERLELEHYFATSGSTEENDANAEGRHRAGVVGFLGYGDQTEFDALTGMGTGAVFYNTTTGLAYHYTIGTGWEVWPFGTGTVYATREQASAGIETDVAVAPEFLRYGRLQEGFITTICRFNQNDPGPQLFAPPGVGGAFPATHIVEGILYPTEGTNGGGLITIGIVVDTVIQPLQVGEVVTGATNGATGTIHTISDEGGGEYRVYLTSFSGYFENNEIITGDLGGSVSALGREHELNIAVYPGYHYELTASLFNLYNGTDYGKFYFEYYNSVTLGNTRVLEGNVDFRQRNSTTLSGRFSLPTDVNATYLRGHVLGNVNNTGGYQSPNNMAGEDEIYAQLCIKFLGETA